MLDMHKFSGRFLNKYFQEEKPNRKTLSEMFMSRGSVKKKDIMKLVNLYFLSNFLLGKQVTTGIDIGHIKMLDDEEQFDQYPWGSIAYMTTVESIKNSIKMQMHCK